MLQNFSFKFHPWTIGCSYVNLGILWFFQFSLLLLLQFMLALCCSAFVVSDPLHFHECSTPATLSFHYLLEFVQIHFWAGGYIWHSTITYSFTLLWSKKILYFSLKFAKNYLEYNTIWNENIPHMLKKNVYSAVCKMECSE